MSWPVTIRPRAEAELAEAMRWYEERRERLGIRFVMEVRLAIGKIGENPHRYLVYYNGFRRAILSRFPYKIFYRIEGERVIVFRILHARQDHTRHMR